jgi:hypothetical protein
MSASIAGHRRTLIAAVLLPALASVALLSAATASAAAPAYDLQGVWMSGPLNQAGAREPANGTQTVTAMNMTTGEFSGTSEVDGTHFVLQGIESGTALEFTQSEGSYSAHDKVPALSILPDGNVGGNGSFEAGNFWIEVTSPTVPPPSAPKPAPKEETPKEETKAVGSQAAFVTVLCNIFPSAPSTSNCTADVGPAGAGGKTPTGTVTFVTTAGTLLGDTCTLAPVTGLGAIAACTVGFTPAPGTQQGAPLPVTAHYSGDSVFASASGGTSPVSASPGVSSVEVANNGGFFSVPMVNPNYSAVTGTVTVSLSGAAGSARASAAASSIASGSFRASRFGVKTVRLKLTKTGLAKLRGKHVLHALLKVSTLDSGKRLSHTSHITLRLHKR